jgi:ribonuclease BN (tRNA processing enzyme)
LGKSPSWQDAGGACSGYLVEEDGKTLLVDCGNGVFSKLRMFCDYVDVDAVVISHLHADHFLDLVPYAYALTYAPRQQPVPVDRWPGTDHPARPALHAPLGARASFRRVVGVWGSEDLIEHAFDLREYDASEPIVVGSLKISFHVVPHYCTTHAIEVASTNGGGRFTFGADSRPTDELVEFAGPERIEFGTERGHPPGVHAVVLEFSCPPARDEPAVGEHAQVLRDRRPAHGEVAG